MCSQVIWFVEYKFIVWFKFINESFAFSPDKVYVFVLNKSTTTTVVVVVLLSKTNT